MNQHTRAPQAIVLTPDADSHPKKAKGTKRTAKPDLVFDRELENSAIVETPHQAASYAPRRVRWLGILVSALVALFSMWAGLTVVQLVESFFARNVWMGWTAFAFASIAGFAALAIIAREVVGLWRLNKLEHVQDLATRAINLDEHAAAEETCKTLVALYDKRPDVAYGKKRFLSHTQDILDPRDRVRLAESLMLEPLDQQAHKIVARRARRVTLLTTVTPAAALDILFVATQNLGMLREIATLYGGKPSSIAIWRLARMVATHLAVSGGLALSDNLIQHFIGKGLMGRLSARFGEGAVNGILTSRIGLSAIDVCRPIPQVASAKDSLTSLLKEVLTFGDSKAEPATLIEKTHGD
jgi:putative membrane protein